MKVYVIAVAALAILSAEAPAALAVTPATYFFYGYVTAVSGGGTRTPPTGTVVPISITVDTSFPAVTQKDHVTTYQNFQGDTKVTPILAATVNGVDTHGRFDTITITQNAGGIYEIAIMSASYQSGPGVFVTLETTMTGVVKNDKIPKRIFPGNFQSATFSISLDPLDQYSGVIVE